jgi:hypothetical protein
MSERQQNDVGPSVQGFSMVEMTHYVTVPLYPVGSRQERIVLRLLRCDECFCLVVPEDALAHEYHAHEAKP